MADSGEDVPVYNLRIADYHTYFVGGSEWGFSVWAHNACQVQTNRRNGNQFRDEVADTLRKAGFRVRTEVYKKTPLGKRFIDIEVSDQNGTVLGGLETKLGGSRYRSSQRAKDNYLNQVQGYSVTVVRG